MKQFRPDGHPFRRAVLHDTAFPVVVYRRRFARCAFWFFFIACAALVIL